MNKDSGIGIDDTQSHVVINSDVKPGPLLRLVRELKGECNRYANGQCQTLACLKRGGYTKGDPVDYSIASCERHEQIDALERLPEGSEVITGDMQRGTW